MSAEGKVSNLQVIAPRGEYSTVTDPDVNLYIADGQIFVYNNSYEEFRRIDLEERPISMPMGGQNKDILFVTTRNSLYSVAVQ